MYKNILSNIQSVSVRILGLYLLMGSSNEVETSVARDIPRISTANEDKRRYSEGKEEEDLIINRKRRYRTE